MRAHSHPGIDTLLLQAMVSPTQIWQARNGRWGLWTCVGRCGKLPGRCLAGEGERARCTLALARLRASELKPCCRRTAGHQGSALLLSRPRAPAPVRRAAPNAHRAFTDGLWSLRARFWCTKALICGVCGRHQQLTVDADRAQTTHLATRVARSQPNRHKGRAQVSGLLGCAILVRNALSVAASVDAINKSLQMQNADHLTPRVMQPTMPNRHKGRTHGKFQKHGLNFAQWEFAH